MQTIETKNLTPGMMTARDACTTAGQVIIPKYVTLNRQLISHLQFYGITEVEILEETLPSNNNDTSSDIINYTSQLKVDIEAKHLKQSFIESLVLISRHLNDVILKNDEDETDGLLPQTLRLLDHMQETVDVYGMLHQIRKFDESTYAHSINVAIICRLMGQWFGKSEEDVDILTLCGLLHDIGKIKIPRSILTKPGRLNSEEYEIIKRHPLEGYNILKNLPIDNRIKRCALMHHERCDSTGYPLGLLKDDIEEFAIIVSIADVYDAMTSNRCYRIGLCPFEVVANFEREGFHKYNTRQVRSFLNRVVDSYMNDYVLLSNGNQGQIVWKNQEHLARPTIYLPSRNFLDLSVHPELYIQSII